MCENRPALPLDSDKGPNFLDQAAGGQELGLSVQDLPGAYSVEGGQLAEPRHGKSVLSTLIG